MGDDATNMNGKSFIRVEPNIYVYFTPNANFMPIYDMIPFHAYSAPYVFDSASLPPTLYSFPVCFTPL
jgi:hypothetical protein